MYSILHGFKILAVVCVYCATLMDKVIHWPEPYGIGNGYCEHMRLTNETETLNPFVAAYDIVRGFQMIYQCHSEITSNMSSQRNGFTFLSSPLKFFADMAFFSAINLTDVYVVIFATVLWTLGRHFVVSKIYKPAAKKLGVLSENELKFSESAWKGTACSLMWCAATYVTFFCGYDFFDNPLQQYADWTLHKAPTDLSTVYAIEASFYFHSVYATLFMDEWRRDSVAMLCHHFVALVLIIFSYSISCLKIGVLIFFLDDINDVVLEVGKCATYLRKRTFGYSRIWDVISNVMAVLFAVFWIVFRLYMHLTKVWRSGSIGIWVSHPVLPLPFHLFQNAFLGSLYAFYVYWFWFIILFIIRIFSSAAVVEDPREGVSSKKGSLVIGKSEVLNNGHIKLENGHFKKTSKKHN